MNLFASSCLCNQTALFHICITISSSCYFYFFFFYIHICDVITFLTITTPINPTTEHTKHQTSTPSPYAYSIPTFLSTIILLVITLAFAYSFLHSPLPSHQPLPITSSFILPLHTTAVPRPVCQGPSRLPALRYKHLHGFLDLLLYYKRSKGIQLNQIRHSTLS